MFLRLKKGLTVDFFLQLNSKKVFALASCKLLEFRGVMPKDPCMKDTVRVSPLNSFFLPLY